MLKIKTFSVVCKHFFYISRDFNDGFQKVILEVQWWRAGGNWDAGDGYL